MIQSSWIPLEEVIARRNGSVDPSKFPDEVFELLSIPAFDAGRPEVVRGRDIGSSKQVVRPGDVLLSKIVPHIRRAWVVSPTTSHRLIASGEWIVFRDERFLPGYLKHLLTSEGFHRQFMQTVSGVGGSLLRARPSEVAKIRVPVPSKVEQRRVATILDKADSVRRKRQEAIRLADELLRAVFIDMFGSPDGSSKWPQSSVSSMVASIESGWSAPSRDLDLTDQDLAVLKVSAVSTGWFLPNEAKAVDRSIVDRPLVFPRQGDLLFSRANTRELVAACCLVEEDVEERFLPDKLWRITAEPRNATNEYLCYLFRHPAFRHELTKQATGTSGSMLNISQGKLLSTPAPRPPIALQEKFSKIVTRSQAARRNSLLSLRDVESLKDSLTAKLFG